MAIHAHLGTMPMSLQDLMDVQADTIQLTLVLLISAVRVKKDLTASLPLLILQLKGLL